MKTSRKVVKMVKSLIQKRGDIPTFFSRLLFLADYANLIYIDCIEICSVSDNSKELSE